MHKDAQRADWKRALENNAQHDVARLSLCLARDSRPGRGRRSVGLGYLGRITSVSVTLVCTLGCESPGPGVRLGQLRVLEGSMQLRVERRAMQPPPRISRRVRRREKRKCRCAMERVWRLRGDRARKRATVSAASAPGDHFFAAGTLCPGCAYSCQCSGLWREQFGAYLHARLLLALAAAIGCGAAPACPG